MKTSEQDDGYVTLVNAKLDEDDKLAGGARSVPVSGPGSIPISDGTITYTELKGDVVLDDVDFGYTPETNRASRH